MPYSSIIAGAIAAGILTSLGLLHLYWAAGGAWGTDSVIPTNQGRPVLHTVPILTVIVASGLFGMAALLAIRIGWIAAPGIYTFTHLSLRVMYGIFLLRAIGEFRYCGFFKRVRDTRFAKFDTRIYSPLCLLLAALIMICAET